MYDDLVIGTVENMMKVFSEDQQNIDQNIVSGEDDNNDGGVKKYKIK